MANVPGQSAAIRDKAYWGEILVIEKNQDSGDFGTTISISLFDHVRGRIGLPKNLFRCGCGKSLNQRT